MATEVEKLVVSLEARLTNYERQLKKATAATDRAAKQIEGRFKQAEGRLMAFGAGVGRMTVAFQALAAAVVGSQVTQALRGVVTSVAEIGRTADVLGIPVEKLQALQAVAASAHVDVAGLKDMLQEFSAISSEAAQGQGDMAEILKANNLSLKDAQGNMRPVMDLLGQWADLIKNAKSEQDRLNLASVGFTDIGRALIPVLKGGAAGLEEQMNRARDLQGFLNQEMVNTAIELEKRMDTLGASFETAFKRGSIAAIAFVLDMANAVEKATLAANRALSGATRGLVPNLQTNAARAAVIERMAAAQRTGRFDTAAGFESFRGGTTTGTSTRSTVLPVTPSSGSDTKKNENLFGLGTLYRQQVIEHMEQAQEELNARIEEGKQISTDFLQTFARGMMDGKNAADALRDSISNLSQQLMDKGLQMAVNALFSSFTAGLGGAPVAPPGGFTGLVPMGFGGFRQHGGPVSAGRSYVVGENGPEMFVPRASGAVAANGGATVVRLDLSPDVEARVVRQADERTRVQISRYDRQLPRRMPDLMTTAQMRRM